MNVPNEITQSPSEGSDEIFLYDIWQDLVSGWQWILGGLVVGLMIAAGYIAVTPPEYEAMALVRIGQVGQIGQLGQNVLVPIEAPPLVVERIMFPTFKDAVARKMGWSGGMQGAVYAASLSAKPAKAPDLIELRVRGLSREDAASSLAATIEYLATKHKEIAQPAIESVKLELEAISDELGRTRKMLAGLARATQMQDQVKQRERFSDWILHAQLSAANEVREWDLRRREAQYREAIAVTTKAITAAFAEPSVPQEPVAPRKRQILMLAALGGAFFGGVVMLFRRGWQRRAMARKLLASS